MTNFFFWVDGDAVLTGLKFLKDNFSSYLAPQVLSITIAACAAIYARHNRQQTAQLAQALQNRENTRIANDYRRLVERELTAVLDAFRLVKRAGRRPADYPCRGDIVAANLLVQEYRPKWELDFPEVYADLCEQLREPCATALDQYDEGDADALLLVEDDAACNEADRLQVHLLAGDVLAHFTEKQCLQTVKNTEFYETMQMDFANLWSWERRLAREGSVDTLPG